MPGVGVPTVGCVVCGVYYALHIRMNAGVDRASELNRATRPLHVKVKIKLGHSPVYAT